MKKFNPPFAATTMSLAVFTLLIGLGAWQVQRLHWKTALIADVTERMAKPPVPLPEQLGTPASWEFRRVTMAGRFDNDHVFLIKPRTLDGVSGYHMLVPFLRLSGGVVMVNRGWISDGQLAQAVRPEGTLQIEGIVRLAHPTYFTPQNDPQKNDWYWADPAAMGAAAKLKNVSPVIVTISSGKPGVYPLGGKVELDIPNNHQQYAIFWFLMAVVSQIIFILRFKER